MMYTFFLLLAHALGPLSFDTRPPAPSNLEGEFGYHSNR